MITLKKSDIGGEIISILTKGMYSDPKDALREYVQNSVDAKCENIEIKIRHNNIVVQDDGSGMDFTTMRNAIRLGVSDKNPKNHVGFMGIGIYSSFHICEQLVIYSKVKGQCPNRISFDFKKMRNELEGQREARFKKEIEEEELIALQKLLENNIIIEKLNNEDFVKIGTRVELNGLEPDFFKSLSKFDEVADYLEKVTPLPFNPRFKWGKNIENKIKEFCEKNNSKFKLVNIKLQVNEDGKNLFKPYTDEDFEPEPLQPYYIELRNENEVFGLAWGCLNKDRDSIKNEKVRGFLLKKQGFTIGKREDLLEYFGRPVFFNRTIGEIIVTNTKLLPNASRSTFEPSLLKTSFRESLQNFAKEYYEYADNYQEDQKANDDLNKAIIFFKESNAQLEFYRQDPEKLLEMLFKLKKIFEGLEKKKKAGRYKNISREKDYEIVIDSINKLANQIRFEIVSKKKKSKNITAKSESQIADENKVLPNITTTISDIQYKSLLEVLDSFGLDLGEDIKMVFQFLDEQYIQPSKSKNEYQIKLRRIKQDIEDLLED